jgi:hypothetical protein
MNTLDHPDAIDELLEANTCISPWAAGHAMLNIATGEVREINCKSWKCPKHRSKWVHRWKTVVSRETELTPVDRLITLTLASTCTPAQLARAKQLLFRALRRKYGQFEYLAVLEFTSRTRLPHLHILARSLFIPQRELSHLWKKSSTSAGIKPSPVVYIEAPRSQAAAAVYAVSYALDGYNKKQDIPMDWKGRKITYSRHFFEAKSARRHWLDWIEETFGPPDLAANWIILENGKKYRPGPS